MRPRFSKAACDQHEHVLEFAGSCYDIIKSGPCDDDDEVIVVEPHPNPLNIESSEARQHTRVHMCRCLPRPTLECGLGF